MRLFPCRDGIFSVAWPSALIVPRVKHLLVCICIVVSAFVVAFITDSALTASSSINIDSYKFYLLGVLYFIDPLVRSNQTFIVIPCIFYLRSHQKEGRRGKYTILCYILIFTITPLITLTTVFNWVRFY